MPPPTPASSQPACTNCGGRAWSGGASLVFTCTSCGHTVTAAWWFMNNNQLSRQGPGGAHTWDTCTSPCFCRLCLVDSHNPAGAVPCPGVPTNWPQGSGATSYPDCLCGINDWKILMNGKFACQMCNGQYDLGHIQVLATAGQSFGSPPPAVAPVQLKIKLPAPAPTSTFYYPLDDSDEAPPKPPKPPPDRCTRCNRELSKEMDQYWGKDPNEAKKCRPCRTNKPF